MICVIDGGSKAALDQMDDWLSGIKETDISKVLVACRKNAEASYEVELASAKAIFEKYSNLSLCEVDLCSGSGLDEMTETILTQVCEKKFGK